MTTVPCFTLTALCVVVGGVAIWLVEIATVERRLGFGLLVGTWANGPGDAAVVSGTGCFEVCATIVVKSFALSNGAVFLGAGIALMASIKAVGGKVSDFAKSGATAVAGGSAAAANPQAIVTINRAVSK